MKKIFSAILGTAVCLTSVSGFAMNAKQEGDRTVILEGNTEYANTMLAVDVYVNGKSKADLFAMKENGENILDALVARVQTVTDENGNFEVSFDIAKNTGKYTVFAGTMNEELEPYTFVFVSSKEYSEFANDFKNADASDIKEIINDNNKCYILGITEEEAKALNSSQLSGVVLNTVKESDIDVSDRDAVWAEVDKAYFVQKLNEHKVSDVLAEDDSLTGISSSETGEWLKKDFVTEYIRESFSERLLGQDFESYKDYEDYLIDAFILATVENADGYVEVEEIITAFEDRIDINVTSSVPDRVWNKLAGNDYDSLEDLAKAFKEFEEEGNTVGSSGGGGGSKGSDSKNTAGVAGSIVTKPLVNNVEDNKLSPEIFDDLDSVLWAKEAILALAEKNIINGVGDNKFNPGANVTREQFAKIVVGAFTPEAEEVEISFSDVAKGSWYFEFVAKAYAKGIANGMGNGKFGVGEMITRQDMCVMIYNAAKASGINMDFEAGNAFDDDALIADYAKTAVYALKAKGAISGVDGKNFAPQNNATRAEAAKIIYALVK